MRNKKQNPHTLFDLLIIFILVIISILVFISYPLIYDFFVGEDILENHIHTVIGTESNRHKAAILLMGWASKNIHYPLPEEKIFLIAGANGFYKIENKTRLFIRSGSASWTIKTKLARCGESARYFVETMNYLGYKARIVHPNPYEWDHVWAEYFDEQGNKIIVDPSSNKVILNREAWIEGKNLTLIEAIDLEGNKEDVTSDYKN